MSKGAPGKCSRTLRERNFVRAVVFRRSQAMLNLADKEVDPSFGSYHAT